MDIAVLGAGVTGLTVARKLHDSGINVAVYDKDKQIGGLAKSRITDGYIYDPHGGHVFNSKNQNVVKWVFSICPKEKWWFSVRNAKIFFKGKYISYPFELSLCDLPIDDAIDCALGFITAQKGDEPSDFENWLVWNFGNEIANAYMLPYNRKIWAYPLNQMGVAWMQGKMPLPTKKEILRSLVIKDSSERKMPHSTFYYPIYGGIQTMVNAIAKPLNIKLEEIVELIERDGVKWLINGVHYDKVISTIPLKTLPTVMKIPMQIVNAINGLKFNSLTTFLVDCPPTNINWMYIPNPRWKAHRIGYQSTLSPKATPNNGGSGAFEIISEKQVFIDNDLIKNALPDELSVGHIIDTQFSEYAYVIHDLDYAKNTGVVHNYFNGEDGFYSIGRWGNWNYHNMDMCMLEAFETAKKIIAKTNNVNTNS
jgi:protoporphyrinogen oxidase